MLQADALPTRAADPYNYFAFKFMTQHTPTLCDFTNVVAQAMCDEEEEEDTGSVPARTKGWKTVAT
jgi:hypothetical protein